MIEQKGIKVRKNLNTLSKTFILSYKTHAGYSYITKQWSDPCTLAAGQSGCADLTLQFFQPLLCVWIHSLVLYRHSGSWWGCACIEKWSISISVNLLCESDGSCYAKVGNEFESLCHPSLFSVTLTYIYIYIYISVKRELSFQQAIWYLSFRWINILHAWTVNKLVKNPKHIIAITSLPKPDLYPFAISQECQNYASASQMPDYIQSMHVICSLWNSKSEWLAEMTIPFSQWHSYQYAIATY